MSGNRWLLALCATVAAGPHPQSRAPQRLAPESTLVETLGAGETRAYELDAPADAPLELSIVERQGMAGTVVVLATDGRELGFADLARRYAGARRMVIPQTAVRIELRPANHAGVERICELTVHRLQEPADRTRLRIEAERALSDGERAYRLKQPGYLAAAQSAYERSRTLWQQVPDGAREADTLAHNGLVLYERGEMAAAHDAYQRAETIWSAEHDQAGIATALHGKALVAGDRGQQKDAEQWATRALEIRRSLGDRRGQIEPLFVLGSIRLVTGPADEALRIDNEAIALARQAGDRVREADGINFLAVQQYQLGRWAEAAEGYEAALAIDREEQEPVRAAQRLNNLGSLANAGGDIRKAIAYLEEALPIRRSLASPNSYGNTLYNLALGHAELGEYQKALAGYQEALALFRRTSFARGEGFVLRALGDLYLATGEDARAEQFLRRAAERWRAITDRRGEVLALNSLGELAARRRDLPAAAALQRQSLEVARAAGLQREEAQARARLAAVSSLRGDHHVALDEATGALLASRQVGDKIAEANALRLQGAALGRLGEHDRARDALVQAIGLFEAAGTRLPHAVALDELARVERDSGRLDAASERVAQALSLIEAVGATAGNRESRMQFAAEYRRTFDLAIDLAMRQNEVGRAFELSERGRARGLLDMLRETRFDIRAGVDPELLSRERNIQELLDAKHERFTRLLAASHSAAREAQDRQEIDRLVESYRAVQEELRARSPAYAALVAPRTLTLGEVQHLIGPETALVEFWLGETRSFVFVVTRTGCRGFALPARSRIGPIARRAYRSLNARNEGLAASAEQRAARVATADADFVRSSAELGRLLFGPIQAGLRARNLWVVSDGELEYLPIAAMTLPGSTEPLVARYEISRLPSASVLAIAREQFGGRQPAGRTVAVFADPVFRPDDPRVSHQAVRDTGEAARAAAEAGVAALPRLRFSRDEAQAIAALAPGEQSRSALDFDANRGAAMKTDLGRYRIVHFATHGLMNSRHPELSGIVLSMVTARGQPQDGFLRLHEIYNLKLNADLVVLSACQTALGQDVRSEGLIGLVRGFMYAGSPQVLASLWSVRDRATAEFMRRFYAGLLQEKLSAQAALRRAQLSMLKDPRWNQPYFWAAFTLQGGR